MKLLFICTHNRCRSILAEAITNYLAGDQIIAVSAGSSPQGEVHPLTLRYLSEWGIPVAGLKSQSWDDFELFGPDAVLTLCDSAAKEACPVWFDSSIQISWELADPSKTVDDVLVQQAAFEKTKNVLMRRIEALLEFNIQQIRGQALKTVLDQIATQIN